MADPLMGELKEMHDNSEIPACQGKCWAHVPAEINWDLLEVDPNAEFTVTLGLPTAKAQVAVRTALSMSTALLRLLKAFPNIHIEAIPQSDLCVSAVRNRIVEQFLKNGSQFLIFLDYDMEFHPDALVRIVTSLQHPNISVYGAAYFARRFPFQPFVPDDLGQWITGNGQLPVGVQECLRFGTGCLGIRRDVFERITKPYFRLTYSEAGKLLETEDCYFGRKLEELGIKAYIDTGIICQHLVEIAVPSFFESKKIVCESLVGRIRYEFPHEAKQRHI